MENDSDKKKGISVEVPQDVEKGTYSNLCIITHSASEFLIDFAQIFVDQTKTKVRSRIVMTPDNTKRLLLALQANLRIYEQTFGEIKLEQNNSHTPNGNIPPIVPFGTGEA